ncbi:hypothetical protein CEXT_36441 [Caerostris extrusa]|uniref:Uncharacterized protein n=1 Tax=Caerostris extrusa TaxID=172846 RepID=A0AAV4RFH9_CAEEX|nr:hypothetical protein CEXT_36441 [Caerostris extrusa]
MSCNILRVIPLIDALETVAKCHLLYPPQTDQKFKITKPDVPKFSRGQSPLFRSVSSTHKKTPENAEGGDIRSNGD